MTSKSRVTVFKPIDASDYSVTPFKAHKNYYFNQGNYSASYGANIFVGHSTSSVKIPIGANDALTYPTTSLGKYQQVIHNSIDNMFYARSDKPFESYGTDDIFLSKRNLPGRVNVISVPQKMYGENIKPGSVTIVDSSRSGSYGDITTISLSDDRKENLLDAVIVTGSFASSSALVGYWGFNEFYKDQGTEYLGFTNYAKDGLINKHPAYLNKVKFSEGITTTGAVNERSGVRANFPTTGSMRIYNHKDFNFRSNKDFAISFWAEAGYQQDSTDRFGNIYRENTIICKDGRGEYPAYSLTQGLSFKKDVESTGCYPFKIQLNNHRAITSGDRGKIQFSRSDTNNIPTVTSSAALFPNYGGTQHHILCQRSSSYLQIWVDGVLSNQVPDTTVGDTHNASDLWIGGSGIGDYWYSGSIDELRIYNEALPTEAILSLANNHYITSSAYQTNVAGNVFYSTGHVCITPTLPKYKYILTGQTGNLDYGTVDEYGFSLSYKGSHTIYENQAICKIDASDFNLSINPTLRPDNDPDSYAVDGFVSSSAFNPYITTIGLYDDNGQMLAIGKLAQPIKNPDNVDLNIIVRWDV